MTYWFLRRKIISLLQPYHTDSNYLIETIDEFKANGINNRAVQFHKFFCYFISICINWLICWLLCLVCNPTKAANEVEGGGIHHDLGLCRIVILPLICDTSEFDLPLEPPPPPPFDCCVVCPRVRTVGLVLLVHHWWWRPSPWWMIARHCGRRALPCAQTWQDEAQHPYLFRPHTCRRVWMSWRRQRENITPPSGRFRPLYPSSSRILRKAC